MTLKILLCDKIADEGLELLEEKAIKSKKLGTCLKPSFLITALKLKKPS